MARLHVTSLILLNSPDSKRVPLLRVVGLILIQRETAIYTILGVGCHAESCDHHRVFDTVTGTKLLCEATNLLVWEHLTYSHYLRSEVEVLRDLLDSLSDHRCLDDVFRAHRACWHGSSARTSLAKVELDGISWDLRTWSKDLPDFERAFKLDDLNGLHWILITRMSRCILCPQYSCSFWYLISSDNLSLSPVKRRHVSASTPDRTLGLLSIGEHGLTRLSLRCAIWSSADSSKTLSDERVDIQTEIGPAVTTDESVRDAGMHLVCYDGFRAIAKH